MRRTVIDGEWRAVAGSVRERLAMAGNDWQRLTVSSGWQWLATVDRVWSAESGEPERYIKTSVAFHRNASCSNLIARIRWKFNIVIYNQSEQYIIKEILDAISRIHDSRLTCTIHLEWVPGQMNIEGNERADQAAKAAAEAIT